MDKDTLHLIEVRMASNIELLKNFDRFIFPDQKETNLSENEGESLYFRDIIEDLEDIRQQLDEVVDKELAKDLPY
jgi:hypothetical protein